MAIIAVGSAAAGTGDLQGWRLVWADEFEGNGLPDPAKWGYEVGFIRNNEAQYYTRERLDNVRQAGGVLVIEGRKEDYVAPDGKKSEYTAASINTLGKLAVKYGRVEMRAKLPRGRGTWPAFWMLGTNRVDIGWPRCGEIDIMEFVGYQPDSVFGTMHWHSPDSEEQNGHASEGKRLDGQKPSDDFHVYAVEWFEDRIDFFFDGKKFNTFQVDKAGEGDDNPFRKPHYMLLNLAIGGAWGGQQGIDESIFPQRYEIDYVRVYEKE